MSNRAPFEPGPTGAFRRGAGGLVTAMLTVAEATGAPWVACARSDAERTLAKGKQPVAVRLDGELLNIRYVRPSPSEYHKYYSVISNPLLWFIQHYLWDLTHEPTIDDEVHDAWEHGYVRVNQLFAEEVAEVAKSSPNRPLILTQDYQLYLAPAGIRELLPDAAMQHFVHIPWPTPQYWKILPQPMRDAIVHGLLANDIVAFQSTIDAHNFLLTCEQNLGLAVDMRERTVLSSGRVTWVRSYPISIDIDALETLAESRPVKREEETVAAARAKQVIVRVDRTDPSKNIIRGFRAYDRLLASHAEHRGKVQFWAFLQPSRQDVAEYREYLRAIRRTADAVNNRWRKDDWEPIRLEIGENIRRATALYKTYDVLLINSIYDGMNLVAKEGSLVNQRDGVLVLSENAGAHEELGEHALTVNPFDVDDTAEALHRALTLPQAERHRRAEALRQIVRTNDLSRWVSLQLQDLRDLLRD
ncbi:MAG TPA: trehalose-6-phosphate synthase [Candidatus Dormibacteraeota bacterium]